MVTKCDICGYAINPTDNFCGGCNVDLREPKNPDEQKTTSQKKRSSKGKEQLSPRPDAPGADVIYWCTIQSSYTSFEMTFPKFLYLAVLLAGGTKKLGFCHCSTCNQGYRELLADLTNSTEKKKLTANSREIVTKARDAKIDGVTFDVSNLISGSNKKESEHPIHEIDGSVSSKPSTGKITIEIEPDVLENAVFTLTSRSD